MNPYFAEFLGTAILVLLGNGVVANVVLPKTKGHASGLIVIAAGWAVAVFCGACVSNAASGAHLNPALTFALYLVGKIEFGTALGYMAAQMFGAMLGAWLVFQHYRDHFFASSEGDEQLACFSTSPAIRNLPRSFLCELIGTFVLVIVILKFQAPEIGTTKTFGLGAVGLLPVTLLVFGIGVSLGGTTGYAINPARDLGPRIVHHFVTMPKKRDSDWGYAWVPVAGPFAGAALAAWLHLSAI
jgi:glycerol uptake facilitator protein